MPERDELCDGYPLSSTDLSFLQGICDLPATVVKDPSSADEFVSTVVKWKPGSTACAVNVEPHNSPGLHWVVVLCNIEHLVPDDAQDSKRKRKRPTVDQVRGTVRIIDSLASSSLCDTLVSLISQRTKLTVLGVESMGWQVDTWRCGYFAYTIGSLVTRPLIDDVSLNKMPPGFEKVIWHLLRHRKQRLTRDIFTEPPELILRTLEAGVHQRSLRI